MMTAPERNRLAFFGLSFFDYLVSYIGSFLFAEYMFHYLYGFDPKLKQLYNFVPKRGIGDFPVSGLIPFVLILAYYYSYKYFSEESEFMETSPKLKNACLNIAYLLFGYFEGICLALVFLAVVFFAFPFFFMTIWSYWVCITLVSALICAAVYFRTGPYCALGSILGSVAFMLVAVFH